MNIVVTTENAGKLRAAHEALSFSAEALGEEYQVIPVSVESGVADTPLSDEEGVQGCINRIEAAKTAYPDAEIYIALEGVLARVKKDWFVRGWTVVEDVKRQRTTTACGAAVQVPEAVTSSISAIDQFSSTVKDVYAVTPEEAAEVRNIGANGVFSDGVYTRFNTFYDGIRIALAEINNDRNWVDVSSKSADQ